MKKLILIFPLLLVNHAATAWQKNARGDKTMKVSISIGNEKVLATLADNPTAKEFYALLPLEVKLEDYAGTEKISQLQKKLTIQSAPEGYQASTGDLTYYAPWGNLAIFYRDFSYAKGLVSLGKIESGLGILTKNCRTSCQVRIEKI